MRSNLFLSNISVVDHAVIDHNGAVIGGSFNPGFLVSGEVIGDEKVVVDFSSIKKQIKTLIDQHTSDPYTNGFDHKLLVIDGFSDGRSINDIVTHDWTDGSHRIVINTTAGALSLPVDAVRFVSAPTSDIDIESDAQDYLDFFGVRMAEHVQQGLELLHPDIKIEVKCVNSYDPHVIDPTLPLEFFTYSHGLRNSSSSGCQNACHGHLSFIQADLYDGSLLNKIALDLDGAVFIYRDNIIEESDEVIVIGYTTGRGYFECTYTKALNKIIVLDTETTVEYLAAYVAATYNITEFYISEGLSKGVYYS